ncbi:MAG TPA: tetratricopeptide repeat protein, partial [Caldisericia bacterium]|nr:tetratricopeptide repeat protein [Caldisericia bacterium]
LIIDDFHEISEDNEIVSLIKILMKNTNENIHLILSSRFKLQEEFYIDLLRERVFIISNELLKLTRDEIVYFFKFRNILIDKKDAEEIYKKSDGWIIYINLISKFYNKKSEIYDLKIIDKFFEDEIFSLLNDNEREILKIFTLKEVVPKNVVESFYDDGLKILKNLSNKNIFIEEEDNYFKIHPVFKEVVLNKFGKLDKNSSLKLARIYEKYRYYKDAFEIYILFKEYEDGVRIIEIWGLKLFESDDIYILEDLINSIPKRYYSEKTYLILSDMEKIKGNYKKAFEIILKIDPTKFNKKEDRFLKFINGELLYLTGEYKKAFKILNSFSFNNELEIKRVQILAIIYHFLNNDNKFKKYMEKALILSQKKGDLYSETKILNDLVVGWYEPKGEIVESEIMLKKALSITNKNNLFLNPVITGNLAYIKEILGEYKEAEKIGSNALKIARKIGDKSKIIFILRILGSIYIKLNEFDKAKRVLEEALILTEDCPDPSRKIGILYNLSSLYESLNQYDKATLFAKEDLELTKKIGNEKFISQSYLNLGKIYLRAKEYEKSKNFLSMAKDIFEKFGYKLNLFETYLFLFLNPTLESSEKEKIKDKIFRILEEKDYSFYYKSILMKEELDFINQNIF